MNKPLTNTGKSVLFRKLDRSEEITMIKQTKQDLIKTISILKEAEKKLNDANLVGERVCQGTKDSHFEYYIYSEKLSGLRYDLELELNNAECNEMFFE